MWGDFVLEYIRSNGFRYFQLENRRFKIGQMLEGNDWIDCPMVNCKKGMSYPLPLDISSARINKNVVYIDNKTFIFS